MASIQQRGRLRTRKVLANIDPNALNTKYSEPQHAQGGQASPEESEFRRASRSQPLAALSKSAAPVLCPSGNAILDNKPLHLDTYSHHHIDAADTAFINDLWSEVRVFLQTFPSYSHHQIYDAKTMASLSDSRDMGFIIHPFVGKRKILSHTRLTQIKDTKDKNIDVLVSAEDMQNFAMGHLALRLTAGITEKALELHMFRYLAKADMPAKANLPAKENGTQSQADQWRLKQYIQYSFDSTSNPVWSRPESMTAHSDIATPEYSYWMEFVGEIHTRQLLYKNTLTAADKAIYPYLSVQYVTTPAEGNLLAAAAIDSHIERLAAPCTIALWNRFILREKAINEKGPSGDVKEADLLGRIAHYIVVVSKTQWTLWQLTPHLLPHPRVEQSPATETTINRAHSQSGSRSVQGYHQPLSAHQSGHKNDFPRTMINTAPTRGQGKVEQGAKVAKAASAKSAPNAPPPPPSDPYKSIWWDGCDVNWVANASCCDQDELDDLAHWINGIHVWAKEKHGPSIMEDFEAAFLDKHDLEPNKDSEAAASETQGMMRRPRTTLELRSPRNEDGMWV